MFRAGLRIICHVAPSQSRFTGQRALQRKREPMSVIPQTYEESEHCITVKCGLPLTPEFVAVRIKALGDANDFHTQKIIDRWGKKHHARTLEWFKQAQSRLTT